MLTKQHRFAAQILHPKERQVYKTHMCGLCHALGDGYGLLSRLLTSHEMILLNMLTNAQREADLQVVMRRCPLNPTRHVQTNQDEASVFAAAAAIELARASVVDDVQDSHGKNLPAQLVRWLMGSAHRSAIRTLEKFDFDTATFTRLTENQTQAETSPDLDPTSPTALTSASLFAMTARLAQKPQNEAPLAAIGASYGAYLYLMDAYRDFAADMASGAFNPLRKFTSPPTPLSVYREREKVSSSRAGKVFDSPSPMLWRGGQGVRSDFVLSVDGLRWLLGRFETIRAEIQTQWSQVTVVRYGESLEYLLLKPLHTVISDLKNRVDKAQGLHFHRRSTSDILKAALFIFPTGVAGAGLLASNQLGDFEPVISEAKRNARKKLEEGKVQNNLCGTTPCYCDPSALECASCCCDTESLCDYRTGICDGRDATNCLNCVSSGDSNCEMGGCDNLDGCDVGGCDCNT